MATKTTVANAIIRSNILKNENLESSSVEIENKPCTSLEFLKDLNITSADIKVDVEGVKNLILQNDFSILDPAKPFQPFTNKPILGSNFYLGSWEVFQKKLY